MLVAPHLSTPITLASPIHLPDIQRRI